jgi:multidrug efflux pump subunit AcrB
VTWADQSIDVRDRLDRLMSDGLRGLVIVFVMLALFLDLKIAFWVAMGMPFSMPGTGMLMFATDQTLNMLSIFAFLMAIGIVVDDAMVISDHGGWARACRPRRSPARSRWCRASSRAS